MGEDGEGTGEFESFVIIRKAVGGRVKMLRGEGEIKRIEPFGRVAKRRPNGIIRRSIRNDVTRGEGCRCD